MPIRRLYIIAGLGFGDEGKGSVVEFISQSEGAAGVVRYNGGPQAAHHVVLPDGRWHCFSQFTSGSFNIGASGHLAHSMLFKPSNFLIERDELHKKGLGDIMARTSIDPDVFLVTPWDAMVGRMEELARGSCPHGSVGMGVGKAAYDRKISNPNALQLCDLLQVQRLSEKLKQLWEQKSSQAQILIENSPANHELTEVFDYYRHETSPEIMQKAYCQAREMLAANFKTDAEFVAQRSNSHRALVLEGAQGVLLDNAHGFFPHITKTDTTFGSADAFIQNSGVSEVERFKVGILRAYSTRHGAGPFITEDASLALNFPETHNGEHRWQGSFRVGYFDLLTSRYALEASGIPDFLALTHLDTVGRQSKFRVCEAYKYLGNAKESELCKYFDLDKIGSQIIFKRIIVTKSPSQEHQARLTELLLECKPHKYSEFSGWGESTPRRVDTLPEPLIHFLDFLQSEVGLDCPIKILSFGPKSTDKIWI